MSDTSRLPEHIVRPEIRHYQRMALEKDGQQFVGLRDPSLISQQMIVLPEQVAPIVAHFNGQHSLQEISQALGIPLEPLADLAQRLDQIGMLWGPTYSSLEESLRDRYRAEGAFPGVITRMWGEDAAACRATISGLLEAAEDPELDGPVVGIVAPHLDPMRGGEVYAASYRALVGTQRPDRVILLGTNHFGQGDGAVLSRIPFETPLGRTIVDAPVVGALIETLGERICKDEMDHVGEHSVQLHLPWIQQLFGEVPIVAALVPDPNSPMLSDDGARCSHAELIGALREKIAAAGGRSLVVASSDLSHVGPAFGDPKPVDEERQDEVERTDRELLGEFARGDKDAFIAEVARRGNLTRWCSVGSMTAATAVASPSAIELIDYRQAIDDRRLSLVSCAAIALVGNDR